MLRNKSIRFDQFWLPRLENFWECLIFCINNLCLNGFVDTMSLILQCGAENLQLKCCLMLCTASASIGAILGIWHSGVRAWFGSCRKTQRQLMPQLYLLTECTPPFEVVTDDVNPQHTHTLSKSKNNLMPMDNLKFIWHWLREDS